MQRIEQLLFDIDNSNRGKFWQGRAQASNNIASAIYLLIAFIPLVILFGRSGPTKIDLCTLGIWRRLGLLALGVVVSIGPPAWFWIEGRSFDDWANLKRKRAETRTLATSGSQSEALQNAEKPAEYLETPEQEEKRLRETFKLNADSEKAFWAAIVAVYAAVLLKF